MLTLMTGGVFEVQYATLKHIALLTQVMVRVRVRVRVSNKHIALLTQVRVRVRVRVRFRVS